MPREPQWDLSRYKFAEVAQDSDGNAYLEDREPPVYEAGQIDDITHTVKDGDTWLSIAQFYYWDLNFTAAELWHVLADMQPVPVINPFKRLKPGSLIILPGPERVSSEILATKEEVLQ